MRLSVDPIQLNRQISSIKQALRAQTTPGNPDQDKTTGRVGYHVFPHFMVVLAGELRQPPLRPNTDPAHSDSDDS